MPCAVAARGWVGCGLLRGCGLHGCARRASAPGLHGVHVRGRVAAQALCSPHSLARLRPHPTSHHAIRDLLIRFCALLARAIAQQRPAPGGGGSPAAAVAGAPAAAGPGAAAPARGGGGGVVLRAARLRRAMSLEVRPAPG